MKHKNDALIILYKCFTIFKNRSPLDRFYTQYIYIYRERERERERGRMLKLWGLCLPYRHSLGTCHHHMKVFYWYTCDLNHTYLSLSKDMEQIWGCFPTLFPWQMDPSNCNTPLSHIKVKSLYPAKTSVMLWIFSKYVMVYHIYIISQSSEKIKWESIMNFNWSLIVNHVSHITFNICAQWIIECKNRKDNIQLDSKLNFN